MASSLCKSFLRAQEIISVILYVLVCITITQETTPVANLSVDPCYNYTVVDDPWRSTSNQLSYNYYYYYYYYYYYNYMCDQSVTWSGWYRLFINGLSTQIPDTCVDQYRCGTNIPLWIQGGHPRVEDGVVTRDVCGHYNNDCCYYRSYPIKVKACPGNYYVYELISPTVCNSAYCAAIVPDPCYNYAVLDDPWRATNNIHYIHEYHKSDTNVTWSGWYRLFINGLSAQIPETCITSYGCGTHIPLWIRGGHPTVQDGVVPRGVCGHWNNDCCYYGSFSIKVKACHGNYYVYELINPAVQWSAYCADVGSINSSSTAVRPVTLSTDITLLGGCINQTSERCLQNMIDQLENITVQVLPLSTVVKILNMVFNASEKILDSSSSANPTELASFGNFLLKASEKLISTLVKPTVTTDSFSFALPAVEGQVFMVGPQLTLDKIPRLDTTYSSVNIDLIGIAKNNNEGSAAVAFMSFTTIESLLKPDFFNTTENTIKTMMSTVISATLPKTTNTKLTKPVNFIFRHIREFDPSGSLSCVYWNINEWIVDGCSVLETNSSYTVCSCDHLSIFALIMQTSHPHYDMFFQSNLQQLLLIFVYVTVGVVFILALLTLIIFIAVHSHV